MLLLQANGDPGGGTISRMELCITSASNTYQYERASTAAQSGGIGNNVQASGIIAVTSNTPYYGFVILTPSGGSNCRIIGDNSAPFRSYIHAVRIA